MVVDEHSRQFPLVLIPWFVCVRMLLTLSLFSAWVHAFWQPAKGKVTGTTGENVADITKERWKAPLSGTETMGVQKAEVPE